MALQKEKKEKKEKKRKADDQPNLLLEDEEEEPPQAIAEAETNGPTEEKVRKHVNILFLIVYLHGKRFTMYVYLYACH